MIDIDIKTTFANSSYAIIRHQRTENSLKLIDYNQYLINLFGLEIISNLTNPLENINFINQYSEWHKLYKEIFADHKIHVLTSPTYTNNKYSHYFVMPDINGTIITIIYLLPNPESRSWEEERLAQKVVNNVVESLWVVDAAKDVVFIASSHGTYYGHNLTSIPKSLFRDYLLNKDEEITKQINTFFNDQDSYFIKFISEEMFANKKPNSIRYFLTKLLDKDNSPEAILIRTKNLTSRMENLKLLESDKMMLQTILLTSAEGIYGVDLLGECTFANPACLKHLGLDSQEQLIGYNMHAILHHHSDKGVMLYYEDSSIRQILKTGKPSNREEKTIWRKDGSYFTGECYGHPLYNEGVLVGAIITFYDITQIKKYVNELEELERSKSYLISNLPGIAYRCQYDRERTMLFVSEGVKDLLGYIPAELLHNQSLPFNDLILPEYRDFVWRRYSEVILERGKFREEYRVKTKDDKVKWVLELGQGVYSETGEVIALEGIIVDITEQKERQQEAEYLNKHDKLTGVYNRVYFDELVEKYNQNIYYPLTYMVCDINGLHLINDAYGREYGNSCLFKTIELIKNNTPPNSILARTGGDEFSILLLKTSREEAHEVYKKLVEAFKDYNASTTESVPELSVSFGYETNDIKEQDFAVIVKTASEYMKRRKMLNKKSSQSSVLNSIKSTMYERSQETEEHAERLNFLTNLLGLSLGLSPSQLDLLSLFASFHDIGKVGISDNILNKPDKLTADEWVEMRRHSLIGQRICQSSPELMPIADLVLSHHERWDGFGYPYGLKKLEIPLLARILSIVDAYDSMTNDRVYRLALSKEEALAEIKRNSGTQFDPKIVEKFLNLMERKD